MSESPQLPTNPADESPGSTLPPPRSDVTIAIMGPTGTGKSSLIQLITGDKSIEVGHGVESKTSEIKLANYFEPDGRCVTFVDTPGFDDSREGVTDTVILKQIATFLETRYMDGKSSLNGIIYLHRITDPRMGGISTRNLRMFKKLCGSKSLKNVVIVTTRWDSVNQDEAVDREKELMTNQNFFQPLLAEGARFLRHNKSPESARQIMEQLLDKDPIAFDIQVELASGKTLEKTAAGTELNAQMNALIEKHKAELDDLRTEMHEAIAAKDEAWRKELEAERNKRDKLLTKWDAERQQLTTGLDSFRDQAAQEKAALDERLENERRTFLGELEKERKKVEEARKALKEERLRREDFEAAAQQERIAREAQVAKPKAEHEGDSDRSQRQQVSRKKERAATEKVPADPMVGEPTREMRQRQERGEQPQQYHQRITNAERARGAAEERVKVAGELATLKEKLRAAEERAEMAEGRAETAEENEREAIKRASAAEKKAAEAEVRAAAAEERAMEAVDKLEQLTNQSKPVWFWN